MRGTIDSHSLRLACNSISIACGAAAESCSASWLSDARLLALASLVPISTCAVGTFNVSSPTARYTRAKDLQRSANAPELDFNGYLEELCQRVLAAERAGQPAILLNQVTPLSADTQSTVTIHGIPIYRRHPIILFADGGTGKTTIAVSIAGELERRGVSVLYLDWELDQYEHRNMLGRLFGDDLPDVKYRRCERPLALEVDGIAQQVRECGIDYVMSDSIAFACDGPPESAEVAQRYFRALASAARRLPEHRAHHEVRRRRSEAVRQRVLSQRGQGDVVRRTGAINRRERDHRRAVQPEEQSRALVAADGPVSVLRLQRTTIEPTNLADNDQLAAKVPLLQRMKGALRRGPKTLADLAEQLDHPNVDTLDRYVRRHSLVFTRLTNTPDGIHRIALVERRAS